MNSNNEQLSNNILFQKSTYKSEIDDKQKLEKDNFDLKMRIYYLEENLKQIATGTTSSIDIEELRIENANLRLQVDESNNELDQRNAILIKAKGAIEALKNEMDRMKSELQTKSIREADLIRRLEIQLDDNHHLDNDKKMEILQVERQVSSLNQIILSKEHERLKCEDTISELRIELDATKSILQQSESERSKFEQLCQTYQKNLSAANEEIIQIRASADVYKIQANEQYSTSSSLKDVIRESQQENEKLHSNLEAQEKANREKIIEITSYYEQQIQDTRAVLKEEMEKLKLSHSQMLRDVRENYQIELNKSKAHFEETTKSMKGTEAGEVYRVKEDMLERLHEKAEEVSSLKSSIQLERNKTEHYMKDLEHCKSENRMKDSVMEELRRECSIKQERITNLTAQIETLTSDNKHVHEKYSEMKEVSSKESLQLTQYQNRIDYLSEALKGFQYENQDYEKSVNNYELEIQRLEEQCNGLQQKCNDLQEVKKEYEKMTFHINQLKLEHSTFASKNHDNEREILHLREIAQEKKEALDRLEMELMSCRKQCDSKQEVINEETNRADSLESALHEQREMSRSLKMELDIERDAKVTAERKVTAVKENDAEVKSNLHKSCALLIKSLISWDKLLINVLEPSTTRMDKHSSYSSSYTQRSHTKKYFDSNHSLLHKRQNMYDSELSEDVSSAVEELIVNSDELVQKSVSFIERVQMKLEQIQKINSLFDDKSQHLLAMYESKIDIANDKSSLSMHYLSKLQGMVDQVKHEIDKDKKYREQSANELRDFQQKVIGEHMRQLSESESKYTSVMLSLEQMKHNNSSLQHEINVLKEENLLLVNESKQYDMYENEIRSITEKLNKVVESNKLAFMELDDRERRIVEHQKNNDRLAGEKNSLLTAVERAKSQIDIRDKLLHENDIQISTLKCENDMLKSRQINPELQKTMRQTQMILQNTYSGSSTGRSSYDDNVSKDVASASSRHIEVITDLIKSIDKLVYDSISVAQRFEQIYNREGRDGTSKTIMRLQQDLFDLLDANSKLTSQLQQVAIDVKRQQRQAQRSPDRDIEEEGDSHHERAMATKREMYHDERMLGHRNANSSNDISIQRNQNNANSNSEYAASASRSFTGPSLESTKYRANNLTRFNADDDFQHDSNTNLSFTPLHSSFTENTSFNRSSPISAMSRSELHATNTIPNNSGRNVSTPLTASSEQTSFRRSQYSNQSNLAFAVDSYEQNPKSKNYLNDTIGANITDSPFFSSNTSLRNKNPSLNYSHTASDLRNAPSTPYTSSVARDSANRLGKLGQDLQNLASKLENYNTRSSR